jgi:peptide chain release factor 1
MKQRIRDKLDNLADRLQELDRLLATSEAASDMDNYRKLTREHAEITPVVGLYRDTARPWKTRPPPASSSPTPR